VDRIADEFLSWNALAASATLLWLGLLQTAHLVAAVLVFAVALGIVVAWARTRRRRWISALGIAYVDLARSTPPLVSLVVVCYGLPILGLPSPGTFEGAVIALGLLHAAHVGEIYRGGALAITFGQREASRALGLSDMHAVRWVLLPQAIRAIMPALTSQVTQVVRDSPLALMVGYSELLSRAREAQALTANSTAITAAGGVYLGLLVALQASAVAMGRRVAAPDRHRSADR
jgi:His/Glu/Gln/Arg/opine family amino acid ABC transporter permease subunit